MERWEWRRSGAVSALPREIALVTCLREDGDQWLNMCLLNRIDGIVWSSLEFKQMQTQFLDKLPGWGITLAPGSDRRLRWGTVHTLDWTPRRTTVSREGTEGHVWASNPNVESALMSEEFVFSWWLKDFVACAVSWIHVDFHGPCCTLNHTDVSDLCRHLRLWWCLGSELPLRVILMLWCMLQPESMLMSMGLCFYSGPHQCGGLCCNLEPWRCLVHAASVDLIWGLGPTATRSPFRSLCWCQKPCWSSWSMLQRILKRKQISLAVV